MEKDNVNNWLDILADEFDHPAIILWRAVELRHIANALKKHPLLGPILDLGCAEGKIAVAIFADRSLVGLDNCWGLLSKNTNTGVYRALVLGDWCHMPYKDRAFRAVFSNCVIEHIPELGSVLVEVSRVLKKGGIFLFTVPSHKFADFLFFSIIFEKLKMRFVSNWYKRKRNQLLNHFHCYDHNQWKDILRGQGFNLVEYDYYMTKEATFVWDFLAVLMRLLRIIRPCNCLSSKIHILLIKFIKKYYNMDSYSGSGLLLVAQKGV